MRDVVLDSNQYWNDPKMTGARFQSLLDYLRRTGSALVIPRIVRDEVPARYEDELKSEYSGAVASLNKLRKRAFELRLPEQLPEPDMGEEVRRLEQKLLAPGAGVASALLSDYSDISLEEVARRGVLRRKPASPKGEELRDVMVWLATVAYAKRRHKVGFISLDGGFRGRTPTYTPN